MHPLYVKTVIPIVLRARQSIPTDHRVWRKNYESSQESAEMFRKNRSLPCACLRNLSQHLKFNQISSKNSFQTSGLVFSPNNGMIGTSLIGKPASNSEPGKSIRGACWTTDSAEQKRLQHREVIKRTSSHPNWEWPTWFRDPTSRECSIIINSLVS